MRYGKGDMLPPCAAPLCDLILMGLAVFGGSIVYFQRVDIIELQACAEKSLVRIVVAASPGSFSTPGRALAYFTADLSDLFEIDKNQITKAFQPLASIGGATMRNVSVHHAHLALPGRRENQNSRKILTLREKQPSL